MRDPSLPRPFLSSTRSKKESTPQSQAVPKSNDGSPVAFYALVFFTFIVYIAPQAYFPVLKPLHLAQVSAILACLLYVFASPGGHRPLIVFNTETKLLFVIVVLACLSIPFSRWPGGSLDVLTGQLMKAIIVFFLISHLITSVDRLKLMLWYIILFCTFISIIGIKSYLSGNLYELGRIKGAAAGITANPNDLALTLVLVIPFALSMYLTSSGSRKIISGLYILLSTGAIFCTFSRGGFLVLVVIFIGYFLKLSRQTGPKIYVIAAILIVGFFLALPEGYTDRISSIFDSSKDATGSALERQASTRRAVGIIRTHPLVGVGLGMNTLALNDMGLNWTRIHNVFLQIGADLGIPAMLVFAILLYTLIRNMRRIQSSLRKEGETSDLLFFVQSAEVSLLGFALCTLFYPVAYNFYFYYLAGYAVALKKIYEGHLLHAKPAVT